MLTLVTGATGLVGNNVVRMLLDRDQAVRVMVRANGDPRPLDGLGVERCEGDIRDPKAVRKACEGVSQIVHSAAVVHIGWSQLELQRAVNVLGTRHIAQAARDVEARLVYVSSCDAVGLSLTDQPADEDTPFQGKIPCSYVISKGEAEATILNQIGLGLQAVVVNPGFMLGPWDWKPSSGRMLVKIGQTFAPLAPPGGLSVCDVRDVSAGILAAADRGQIGRRYILAGHNCSILELWRRFKQVSGGRPPFATAWTPTVMAAGFCGDFVARLTGREPDINSAAVRMARLFHSYSSHRAVKELDYSVRPLDETIQDAWRWFREHKYV